MVEITIANVYHIPQENEIAVHFLHIAEQITKHSKPFTEGYFIKTCLIIIARLIKSFSTFVNSTDSNLM